jgi:transposase/L-rhamnose mutarotase
MKNQHRLFKPYHQNQLMALPPTFEELIPVSHPVRVVNQIVDNLDLDSVFNTYQGGGSSSYHPRMLLKVLIYGYLCNIYSSRKLESAICENIYFMWLSGMQQPDHNTLNRFRSERLKGVIKEVFSQVVLLMVDSGHLDLRTVYTDGTKIESCANRYTFVWGKNIKRNRARIESQLEELWNYAETGDTLTLIPHLEAFEQAYGFMPDEVTADAGYGSYSNYDYLHENDIYAYVKYALFNKEMKQLKKDKKQKKVPQVDADIAQDPQVSLDPEQQHKKETKAYIKSLLLSERGVFHRKKRGVEVESVFGMLKQNKGFRRFKLSGLNKVSIEFGLLALAHNLAKLSKILPIDGILQFFYGVVYPRKYQVMPFKLVV